MKFFPWLALNTRWKSGTWCLHMPRSFPHGPLWCWSSPVYSGCLYKTCSRRKDVPEWYTGWKLCVAGNWTRSSSVQGDQCTKNNGITWFPVFLCKLWLVQEKDKAEYRDGPWFTVVHLLIFFLIFFLPWCESYKRSVETVLGFYILVIYGAALCGMTRSCDAG